LYQECGRFLANIPEDHELILNGDVIDNPYSELKLPHQRILDIIARISHRQRVVWVRGNHDNGYIPQGFEKVEFKRFHTIGHRLLITHGYDFDDVMPRSQAFIKAFKLMHDLRVKLNVMTNAVNCALENGYEAATCGHTHYPEDTVFNGIRYVNTGAWTETPTFYLLITPDEMALKKIDDSSGFRKTKSTTQNHVTSQKL
jgi:UDP-2,3-diacylglucosamine pyrophosphatase LpxH